MGMEEGGYREDNREWRKENTQLTTGDGGKGDTEVTTVVRKRGIQKGQTGINLTCQANYMLLVS